MHLLVQLVMLLWCYSTTILTDPGGIPANWQLSKDEESGETGLFVGLEQDADSGLRGEPADPKKRFCRKCNQLKPPRCHHCSVCECLSLSWTWYCMLGLHFILKYAHSIFSCRWKMYIENGSSLCMGR